MCSSDLTNAKGDSTHAVNLLARTCGCRKWDVTGLPCSHACSDIIKAKQAPEQYVSPFFKKPMYVEAYKPVIYPVPGPHDWTKTDTPDIVPPVFNITKGRKQEKRRKGRFEVPKPKDTSRMGTITCSNCKLRGHRYTSCTKELRPELLARKNKHVVSNPKSFYLLHLSVAFIYCIYLLHLSVEFICCSLKIMEDKMPHHQAMLQHQHQQQGMLQHQQEDMLQQQAMLQHHQHQDLPLFPQEPLQIKAQAQDKVLPMKGPGHGHT